MDCRLTLNIGETFLEMLQSSYKEGRQVSLMVDDHGLERVEGSIRSISIDRASTTIELDGQRKIDMGIIVAVNGIFRPEYGEC